jgi:ribosomal-protein-alanine N-acetyltransferase
MHLDVRIEVLETPRLRLRPVQAGDEVALTELLQDQEIHRWTASIPYPYTIEEGRKFIEVRVRADAAGESFGWAVTDRPIGTLMGMMGLHDVVPDRGRAELGYWIGEAYRGRGYITEAARRVISWAFETAGFERIQATFLPGNEASAAVMRNIGMQMEGLLRGYGYKNGEHQDLYLQAVLRTDTTWMSTEEQMALVR